MRKVYRLARADDRAGVFQCADESGFPTWAQSHRPMPHTDGMDTYEVSNKISAGWRFGFVAWAHVRQWFPLDAFEHNALLEADIKLFVYLVPPDKVVKGRTQCLFPEKELEPVACLDIDHIYKERAPEL